MNFGRDNIRGGQDLMYYARVETERSYHPEDEEVKQGIARIGEPKPGLNLHVHVIVSRKSLDGKVKLSPGAKSAGNTWELEGRGTVKRGFHMRAGKSGYRNVLTGNSITRPKRGKLMYVRRYRPRSGRSRTRSLKDIAGRAVYGGKPDRRSHEGTRLHAPGKEGGAFLFTGG